MKKLARFADGTGSSPLLVLGLSFLVGCGAAIPPPELVAARQAYADAEKGPAKELAPAQLDTAHQALEEAEASFESDPESEETRVLAYVAERRALSSAAVGATEKARKRRAHLDEEYTEIERKRATMTKEELAATRARLAQESDRVRAGQEAIAQRDAALAQKEVELEKEKKARAEAEGKLTAAIASLAEMGSIKEEARGMVITLNGAVLFATGKYELLPIAKSKLDEVADALKGQGFKKIVIEGHTDSRGVARDNDKLSLQRAEAVKAHLVARGLDASLIEAVGLGSTRPVATNDTPEGRANNRRVELIVTPQK